MPRPVYDLCDRVQAHLDGHTQYLAFGETPPDETSRGRGYVIVDADPGDLLYDRAANPIVGHDLRFRLRVCGGSPSQARRTLDLVREAMAAWHPYPDDRSLGPLEEVDAGPEVLDTSVPGDLRWSYTLTYEIADH